MPVPSTAHVDLVERTSYISSNHHKQAADNGDFTKIKTPTEGDLEGGALRGGGAPHLLSKESLGLLAQYAAVGLLVGIIPNLVTPFMTIYLNMEGTTTTSVKALLNIPWSLKVFIGIITDCFPIAGYRRRPYMVAGWTIAAVCLFIMAFLKIPQPYFADPSLRYAKLDDLNDTQKATFNVSARDSGSKYIILMVLATLGYLIADVAADAVVVEYAQREPEATRGRTQTAIYTVRQFFSMFAQIIVGFGLSSEKYGGTFSFGIEVSTVFLITAIICVPVIPMTWLFVAEKKVEQAPRFTEYVGTLWGLIQSRAVYQVIAFSFLWAVFGNISYVAYEPMTVFWVHATAFSLSISGVIGSLVTTITLAATGKYGLQWDWRKMLLLTSIIIIAMDIVVTMLTTWDVVRSPWFWLGVPIVEAVPVGVAFIISTYVVVELAGEGNEGAIYGLMTTVSNLGAPFALTITKNLNASFSVWNDDIQRDNNQTRRDVTITIFIMYIAKVISFAFLPLLPRQKAETQELKKTGGTSKIMGIITLCYLTFALSWSIMVNIFSIFESTKCLKITGGCKQ